MHPMQAIETMVYKLYRQVKSIEDYFARWQADQLAVFDDEVKKQIYKRYMVKCEVLDRDSFKCQNADCETPTSKLTVHHIKAKRNGGEYKVRNLITICKSCHNAFNRCKRDIRFENAEHLPTQIRGHTFPGPKPLQKMDWKKIRIESKQTRKDAKHRNLVIKFEDLNWEILVVLFRFMHIPYTELDDD